MLTSVLCVCVVTNILHEGLHIVSFYLGCCTSNYNLPTPLINEGGKILAPAFSAACTDGCFAEATKKFLFPISFLLNSILWKTLVFSTGMC